MADQIQSQVSAHLDQLRQTGRVDVRFDLHPPELGRVGLHLSLEDGRMNVRLTVQDDSVKRTLDQQLEPLRTRMSAMGVSVGQFDVRRDGNGPNQNQQRAPEPSAQPAQADENATDSVSKVLYSLIEFPRPGRFNGVDTPPWKHFMSSVASALGSTGLLPATAASLNSSSSSAASATSSSQQPNFMQLLMAQMQNQDPTNPTSATDYVTQMAQFSSVQGITQLNQNISTLLAMQTMTQGVSLIGKTVSYTNAAGKVVRAARSGRCPWWAANHNW